MYLGFPLGSTADSVSLAILGSTLSIFIMIMTPALPRIKKLIQSINASGHCCLMCISNWEVFSITMQMYSVRRCSGKIYLHKVELCRISCIIYGHIPHWKSSFSVMHFPDSNGTSVRLLVLLAKLALALTVMNYKQPVIHKVCLLMCKFLHRGQMSYVYNDI